MKQPEYQQAVLCELRAGPTAAEQVLWSYIRNCQLDNLKFRRQRQIDRFVVDFCCDTFKLVVELDGSIHDLPDRIAYEAERQQWLEVNGYIVLRFTNEQVLNDLEVTLQTIVQTLHVLSESTAVAPLLPSEGRASAGASEARPERARDEALGYEGSYTADCDTSRTNAWIPRITS
jgi:very-short-patch-repair endonuclease